MPTTLLLVVMAMALPLVCSLVTDPSIIQEHHWGGMEDTVGLRFAAKSQHVFTVQKTGKIRVYSSINVPQNGYHVAYDFSRMTFNW